MELARFDGSGLLPAIKNVAGFGGAHTHRGERAPPHLPHPTRHWVLRWHCPRTRHWVMRRRCPHGELVIREPRVPPSLPRGKEEHGGSCCQNMPPASRSTRSQTIRRSFWVKGLSSSPPTTTFRWLCTRSTRPSQGLRRRRRQRSARRLRLCIDLDDDESGPSHRPVGDGESCNRPPKDEPLIDGDYIAIYRCLGLN
jgi:hypothetical protein